MLFACTPSAAPLFEAPFVIGDGEAYFDLPLNDGDGFGRSVALQGRLLAVGAPYDRGRGAGSGVRRGAVYLFSFSSDQFANPRLEAIIAAGASGPGAFDLALDDNDEFGISLALDGRRLVVGARGDDGAGVGDAPGEGAGAVYLFSFTDDHFGGLRLEGVMGAGYEGGKNVSVVLEDDNFGWDVSLDATRLAVSAIFDDGADNAGNNQGAVYLFTFGDERFGGARRHGVIGRGYSGAGDFNLALDDHDAFAHGIDLEDRRLIIGADKDDGFDNSGIAPGEQREYGALYLFTFADDAFGGLRQRGIIGRFYRGPGDHEIVLADRDFFGAVAEMDGAHLAVGAPGDDGRGDEASAAGGGFGAVRLFSFRDAGFAGAADAGVIGRGYGGPRDIDLARLTKWERLGYYVSYEAGRLAVGAPLSEGPGGDLNADQGAVYLFPRRR